MNNHFFRDLYVSAGNVRVGDCTAKSLSHLVHGYLSVYSMVQVCPGLEEVYGTLPEIHGRIREIAGELTKAVKDTSIEPDERIGYIADLMDSYLTFADMDLLEVALEEASRVLYPNGDGEPVLPGRTPNACRLLCDWGYFTGEQGCWELVKDVLAADDGEDIDVETTWQRLLAWEVCESMIPGLIMDAGHEEDLLLKKRRWLEESIC